MLQWLCKAKLLYKRAVMKVEENVFYLKLFDLYKPLLSLTQQGVMEDYLAGNLTVSEIALNHGISRQAVKDCVDKSLKKLKDIEDKLLLGQRIAALEKELKETKSRNKKGDN